MAQYVALRSLNRTIAIRVVDALSGLNVQLRSNVDTLVDLDVEANKIALGHHSAIGQYIQTASNNTITAISGGTTVISGALTTLYPNVVQGNPGSLPPI